MVYAPLLNQKLNARNTAQNSGAAPAGSVIRYDVRDVATLAIQVISNSLSSSIYLQGSLDGVNWANIGGNVLLNQGSGGFVDRVGPATAGFFSANVAEYNFARLTTQDIALTGEAVLHINGGGENAIMAIENLTLRTNATEADPTFTQGKRAGTAGTPASIVLAASTSQQILAANTARRGAMIVNRSGQEVFLRYGATAASATVFSWVLAANEKYEVPFDISAAIQAFSVAAGAAPGILVTEFTN